MSNSKMLDINMYTQTYTQNTTRHRSPQTTGGKGEPNIVLCGNRNEIKNVKTHNRII